MEISEGYYEKRNIEIEKLREVLHILAEFSDAKQVYSTICNVILKYCKKLIEESE